MRHKKLAIGLMAMLLTLATVLGAQAASFVLSGNYVSVGIGSSGALIDDKFTVGLQFDPTGTGTFPQVADFLKPGSPFEFYSLGVNGVSLGTAGYNWGLAGNPFNMVTTNTSGGGLLMAQSNGNAGGLQIVAKTLVFGTNDTVIANSFQIFNVGPAVTNLAFATGLDPDPDVYTHGIYDTNNSISGNTVTAVGPVSGLTITMVGLTPGVVPTVQSSWPTDPYVLASANNDGNGDNTINLAWVIDSLGHDQSIEFDWQYQLSKVPVPPSALLLGTGLLGLVGLGWRRSRKET